MLKLVSPSLSLQMHIRILGMPRTHATVTSPTFGPLFAHCAFHAPTVTGNVSCWSR